MPASGCKNPQERGSIGLFDVFIIAIVLIGFYVIGGAAWAIFRDVALDLPAARKAAHTARSVIPECERLAESNAAAFQLKGKAVVWDAQTDEPFMGWGHLPISWERQAHFTDKVKTVFLVTTTRLESFGKYTDGTPSFRARYTIAVVHYPDNRAVGVKTLLSDPPPEITKLLNHPGATGPSEIVGSPGDVYRWIDSLPQSD